MGYVCKYCKVVYTTEEFMLTHRDLCIKRPDINSMSAATLIARNIAKRTLYLFCPCDPSNGFHSCDMESRVGILAVTYDNFLHEVPIEKLNSVMAARRYQFVEQLSKT